MSMKFPILTQLIGNGRNGLGNIQKTLHDDM